MQRNIGQRTVTAYRNNPDGTREVDERYSSDQFMVTQQEFDLWLEKARKEIGREERSKGHRDGFNKGRKDGYDIGYIDGVNQSMKQVKRTPFWQRVRNIFPIPGFPDKEWIACSHCEQVMWIAPAELSRCICCQERLCNVCGVKEVQDG